MLSMRLTCAKQKRFFLATIDPLEGRIHAKGYFLMFFFGKGERLNSKTISSSGININRFLDGMATEEFTFFIVLISKMFEYFKQLIDWIRTLTYLTHIFLMLFFIIFRILSHIFYFTTIFPKTLRFILTLSFYFASFYLAFYFWINFIFSSFSYS